MTNAIDEMRGMREDKNSSHRGDQRWMEVCVVMGGAARVFGQVDERLRHGGCFSNGRQKIG